MENRKTTLEKDERNPAAEESQMLEPFHVHGPGCSHHHHAHDPYVRTSPKTGRNDPCPCGSGKKFKKCCGGVQP
ncbi:MAG: hypothetical protein RIQ81_1915 [Pseudomonadota bacterium]